MYNIAVKPTTYSAVEFRSRLEARWAAFFDLCRWCWDYEPIDLQGWSPDFLIHTPMCKVLVEVKPVDVDQRKTDPAFQKAVAHWQHSPVLLLGLEPKMNAHVCGVGLLLDPPADAAFAWDDLHQFFCCKDAIELWHEAGNIVRWHPGH